MSLIDVILLIVIIGGVLRGGMQGAIKQITSIIALVLAIILTNMFGGVATTLLGEIVPEMGEEQWLGAFVAHVLLFVLVYLSVSLLGRVIKNLVSSLSLGFIDRILGALFCTLKYVLILSLLLNAWHYISPDSSVFTTSRLLDGALMRWVVDFAPMLIDSPLIAETLNHAGNAATAAVE